MKQDPKDPKIEKLFSAYSEEQKPDRSVTDAAKAYLEAKNNADAARADASSRAQKRPRARRVLFACATVCACAVCVFAGVKLFRNLVDRFGDNDNAQAPDVPASDAAPAVSGSYGAEELYTLRADASVLPDVADFPEKPGVHLKEVREFRFKSDGKRAFVRAEFSIEGEWGVTEVRLDLEEVAARYDGFEAYDGLSSYGEFSGISVRAVSGYEDGEYRSNAYFERGKLRWYLELLSPESDALEKTLRTIFSEN